MELQCFQAFYGKMYKAAFGLGLIAALAGCENVGVVPWPKAPLPAQEALSFEYERFFFGPSSKASGQVARQLRRDAVAFPVEGALTRTQDNPIPAEIMMKVDSMRTGNGRVVMTGDLMIRDLRQGGIMTRQEGYSYSGLMPRVSGGADIGPALFRLIEGDALEWLSGLECSARSRLCAEPGMLADAEPDVAPEDEQLQPVTGGTPVLTEDGSVDLQTLAKRRRGKTGEINAGGLKPEAILAAAPKPEPAAAPAAPAPTAPATEAAPAAPSEPAATLPAKKQNPVALGSTVASLGLLDRGGNWLRTPLVSKETAGRIRNSASGKEIDVLLIPKEGAPGAGSQISLSALSELGASLTDLLTLIVYRLE